MCEPLLPIEELEHLKWAVNALAKLDREPGSYNAENRTNAARGINSRIDWVIRNLNAADEGKKNFGA